MKISEDELILHSYRKELVAARRRVQEMEEAVASMEQKLGIEAIEHGVAADGAERPANSLDSGMSNVFAWRLGEVASAAGDPKRKDVGDPIDRGLILRRLLEEKGFFLVTPHR